MREPGGRTANAEADKLQRRKNFLIVEPPHHQGDHVIYCPNRYTQERKEVLTVTTPGQHL